MVELRMDPLSWLRKQLESADVDLLREMVRSFAETLMSEEADALCGATYGVVQRCHDGAYIATEKRSRRVGLIGVLPLFLSESRPRTRLLNGFAKSKASVSSMTRAQPA